MLSPANASSFTCHKRWRNEGIHRAPDLFPIDEVQYHRDSRRTRDFGYMRGPYGTNVQPVDEV